MFIGIGNSSLADDAAGIRLAEALRQRGVPDVWLESEVEANDGIAEEEDRPLILLDAVDIKEAPGKITLLPMSIVMQNSTLSHRILPVVSGLSLSLGYFALGWTIPNFLSFLPVFLCFLT